MRKRRGCEYHNCLFLCLLCASCAFVVYLVCATFFINKAVAEGRICVTEGDTTSAETGETFYEPEPLTVAVVLTISVQELRSELRQRNVIFSGVIKPKLHEMRLRDLCVLKGAEENMMGILEEEPPFSSPELIAVHKSPPALMDPVVLELGARPKVPTAPVVHDYTLPQPTRSRSSAEDNDSMRVLELKLMLKRLEIQAREKAQAKELDYREKARAL